jgi:hypothetical protein
MEIIKTRTSAGLAALRQEWHVLLERCDTATIFQSLEWNDAWWQSFSHDKRLLLLQVRDRGTLVGLAPFYISRQPGTPFRRLALIGTGTPTTWISWRSPSAPRKSARPFSNTWRHRTPATWWIGTTCDRPLFSAERWRPPPEPWRPTTNSCG